PERGRWTLGRAARIGSAPNRAERQGSLVGDRRLVPNGGEALVSEPTSPAGGDWLCGAAICQNRQPVGRAAFTLAELSSQVSLQERFTHICEHALSEGASDSSHFRLQRKFGPYFVFLEYLAAALLLELAVGFGLGAVSSLVFGPPPSKLFFTSLAGIGG